MKKISIWVCLLVISVLLSACSKSLEQQIAEQLELGQKYLQEENYEQAIVAFTKVIELDPKSLPAYVGRGDAYAAWAETSTEEDVLEKYQYAVSDYETALELEEIASVAQKVTNIHQLLQGTNNDEQEITISESDDIGIEETTVTEEGITPDSLQLLEKSSFIYHSTDNGIRLNRLEPSEGYDPLSLTRLQIQEQNQGYALKMVLETLNHSDEVIALIVSQTGENEFIAAVQESPRPEVTVGRKVRFSIMDDANSVYLHDIDSVTGELRYGGVYKKAIYSVDRALGDLVTREEGYEIISDYLTKQGVNGYWQEVLDENHNTLTVWEHWNTGMKGKVTMDLFSGDCFEEAPYAGVDYPDPNIPLKSELLFNAFDYCAELRE